MMTKTVGEKKRSKTKKKNNKSQDETYESLIWLDHRTERSCRRRWFGLVCTLFYAESQNVQHTKY